MRCTAFLILTFGGRGTSDQHSIFTQYPFQSQLAPPNWRSETGIKSDLCWINTPCCAHCRLFQAVKLCPGFISRNLAAEETEQQPQQQTNQVGDNTAAHGDAPPTSQTLPRMLGFWLPAEGPGQHPDKAAQPPEQEEQLWWVEKFEAKRKELQKQQQLQQQQQPNGSSSQSHIPTPTPAPSVPWLRVVLQLVQLLVAVVLLILWPASLYRAGLYSGKVWLLFWTYLLFFGGGSVWRLVRFGPLTSRKTDQQAKSLATRAAWLSFVVCMPVLHWGAVGSYMKGRATAAAAAAAADWGAYTPGPLAALALYDVLGLGLLGGAVWLNWQAARHLGKAYDRVVQPEALVTTGPYAWVQHPIYTSYMMLFCGYAMLLHSLGYALLALVVCLGYYRSRVALEAGVLQGAFGETYEQYQQKTKLFVPFLL